MASYIFPREKPDVFFISAQKIQIAAFIVFHFSGAFSARGNVRICAFCVFVRCRLLQPRNLVEQKSELDCAAFQGISAQKEVNKKDQYKMTCETQVSICQSLYKKKYTTNDHQTMVSKK